MKNFYDFKVDNIKGLSAQEKEFRNKELELFSKNGFPNKREEAWKFTDLNTILSKNFVNITNDHVSLKEKKFELIKEFDHNYLFVLNIQFFYPLGLFFSLANLFFLFFTCISSHLSCSQIRCNIDSLAL